MMVQRGVLLNKLNEARIGVAQKETFEQSSYFVFNKGYLTTYDDSIMVRVASPFEDGADFAIPANDLITLLAKVPDDEIKVLLKGGEMKIIGQNRKAGISCTSDIMLPIDQVPRPEKWKRIPDGTISMLRQAARTCGTDSSQYLTTCVHITPDRIEASDNFRYFRADIETGIAREMLLPATSIAKLEGLEITRVCAMDGWLHFRTTTMAEVSLRCSHDAYHAGMKDILKMTNPEKVEFPASLPEIIERAEIFQEASLDSRIEITLKDSKLTIKARKENGWYRESKKLPYTGRAIKFEINPQFLVEVLKKTRDVRVDANKMRLEYNGIKFCVCLIAPEETESSEDGDE